MRKRNFLDYIHNNVKLKLNLGCGKKNTPDYWGIDIQDLPGVDEVYNVETGIPKNDETFDEVLAHDFLEHTHAEKNIFVMEEIYRVLKPGGELVAVVPSTDAGGHGAFQDPTHISFWNETKFRYFMHDKYGGMGGLYGIKCYFQPSRVFTYFNEWRVPYVHAVLKKDSNE